MFWELTGLAWKLGLLAVLVTLVLIALVMALGTGAVGPAAVETEPAAASDPPAVP